MTVGQPSANEEVRFASVRVIRKVVQHGGAQLLLGTRNKRVELGHTLKKITFMTCSDTDAKP